MFLTVFIAFISIVSLMVIHELGHFIFAKKFGVRVDEFGIGYPPRLFGKKIGGTIYSWNLLPFGAFVKMPGEIGKTDDKKSFSQQRLFKRALITFGGVLSFWVISILIFSIVSAVGVATVISDSDKAEGSLVQIAAVSPDSPAEAAGLKIGDSIKKFSISSNQFSIAKINDVQNLVWQHKGKNVILTIERGKDIFDVALTPRVNPPEGQGAMGVALVRTAIIASPWYLAPIDGAKAAFNTTVLVATGLEQAIFNLFQGEPTGFQSVGPVGIGSLFNQAAKLGVNYFLQFLATIAVYLAIFNLLPIPALDGGKLLFLAIEKIKGRPVNSKIEQKLTFVFFAMLITLMVFVTFKDIQRLL